MARRRSPRGSGTRRPVRVRLVAVLVILSLLVLFGVSLALRQTQPESNDPYYFLKYGNALAKPSGTLAKDFVLGLHSWETPGPLVPASPGASRPEIERTVTFFVSVKNTNKSKALVLADVLVVPTTNTAPEVRLTKKGFVTKRLAPGAERVLELKADSMRDPSRRPTVKEGSLPQSDDFGVHVYAVIGYEDDVPSSWERLDKPDDEAAFRRVWNRFALYDKFVEIPPDVLTIRA